MPPSAPINNFQIYTEIFFNSKKAKYIKKVLYHKTIVTHGIGKILQALFSVYSNYRCGNHKVSFELHEIVAWVSYTYGFTLLTIIYTEI
jgi:hypothetical protein